MAVGLALQAIAIAWLAAVITPDVAYISLIAPFALAGTGMALVFAPSAIPIGAVVLAIGALIALLVPRIGRSENDERPCGQVHPGVPESVVTA
jgi:hypothetical protein